MKRFKGARFVAYTAVMTAAVYVGTLIGFSSAQFYFNLGDSVILIAACILGPIPGMLAGGLGSFFADLTVYPATMLYTLIIKAIEGLLAGLLFMLVNAAFNKNKQPKTIENENTCDARPSKRQTRSVKAAEFLCALLACIISSGTMMCGYFLCQSLFYGTYATAIVALPMDAIQASISSVIAAILLYPLKLSKLRDRILIPNK